MQRKEAAVVERHLEERDAEHRRSIQAAERFELARAALLAIAAEYSVLIGKASKDSDISHLKTERQANLTRLREMAVDDNISISKILEEAPALLAALRARHQ